MVEQSAQEHAGYKQQVTGLESQMAADRAAQGKQAEALAQLTQKVGENSVQLEQHQGLASQVEEQKALLVDKAKQIEELQLRVAQLGAPSLINRLAGGVVIGGVVVLGALVLRPDLLAQLQQKVRGDA